MTTAAKKAAVKTAAKKRTTIPEVIANSTPATSAVDVLEAAPGAYYDPAVSLNLIDPHPHNVRHDAVADADLVESIRDQGVLVPTILVPNTETPGRFWLVDGHRRRSGSEQAGLAAIPRVVGSSPTGPTARSTEGVAEKGASSWVVLHTSSTVPALSWFKGSSTHGYMAK